MTQKGKGLMTALIVIVFVSLAVPAQAAVIHFTGNVGGSDQDVTVDYLFGTNLLTVKLTNNVVGPTGIIQNVSAISMVVSGGLTGTLTSATGQLIDVAGDGSFANVAGSPDWLNLSPLGATSLGASGPDNTLIGAPCLSSGTYDCTNPSVRGNGPHNPVTSDTMTLVFSVVGASAGSTLSSLKLGFGTEPDWSSTITPPNDTGVPEPATTYLAGAGILAWFALSWRKRA